MKSIRAWTSLERRLSSLGLSWAFHRLPKHLQVARSPDFPHGVEVEHLLPDDYRAFVAQVGYPVVGFSYYCRVGLSFLPPAHLETCSAMVATRDQKLLPPSRRRRPRASAAFFAGIDLSDLVGWSFAPDDPSGALHVWVTDGAITRPVGSFDAWAAAQAERIEAWARARTAAQRRALEQENEGEDDPHRALDYALDRSEPHERATARDRTLHWVCDESKTPYRYSVIDDDGTWHLRPARPFDSVGPFVRGTARVRRAGKELRIDRTGKVVADLTPAPRKPATAAVTLAGKRVTLVGSFRVPNVSLGEFEERIVALGGTVVAPSDVADIYAMSSINHFPENAEAAKAQQRREPSTLLVPLATFVRQLGL
ncbi:MAG: hypothetical protein JNJ54_27885 [Myxococcaceae bacterium]|nr:hypothetical protein [Myxococcaceae bacterium]